MADRIVFTDKNLSVLFTVEDQDVPRVNEIVQIAPLKSRTVLGVKWVLSAFDEDGEITRGDYAILKPHVMLSDPW